MYCTARSVVFDCVGTCYENSRKIIKLHQKRQNLRIFQQFQDQFEAFLLESELISQRKLTETPNFPLFRGFNNLVYEVYRYFDKKRTKMVKMVFEFFVFSDVNSRHFLFENLH